MSSIKGDKCPHCYHYMWQGKDFYECEFQDKVSKLEQENAELKAENERLNRCMMEELHHEGDIHWYELVESEEENELEVIGNIYKNKELLED